MQRFVVGWFYLNINWPKFFVSTPAAMLVPCDSRGTDSHRVDCHARIVAVQLYVSLITTPLLNGQRFGAAPAVFGLRMAIPGRYLSAISSV